MSDLKITKEMTGAKGRYVAVRGRAEAELMFKEVAPGRLSIDHVGVAPELEGQGVGSALVAHAVAEARKDGTKLLARCPFATAQLKRHPEWADVFET